MNGVVRTMVSVLVLLPAVAGAAPVKYAFTAIVTKIVNGSSMEVGDYVTGAYTFNYDSADKVIGTIRLSAPWAIGSSGIPYNPVFSYTATINHSTFASQTSAPNNDPDDASVVSGTLDTLAASEATPAFETGSFLSIQADEPGVSPYGANGYPNEFTGSHPASGGFSLGDVSLTYQITSLTAGAAPKPAVLFPALAADAKSVGKALASQVSLAQGQYRVGNINGACKTLDSFIGQVQKQSGVTIAAPLGADLAAEGRTIAASIGCIS